MARPETVSITLSCLHPTCGFTTPVIVTVSKGLRLRPCPQCSNWTIGITGDLHGKVAETPEGLAQQDDLGNLAGAIPFHVFTDLLDSTRPRMAGGNLSDKYCTACAPGTPKERAACVCRRAWAVRRQVEAEAGR